MPVRIYDIAKKLGITSKEVIARAKDLGIANAKVPSSSLDKITAEYLEQQIGGPPEPEAPERVEETKEAEGIVIVTAPEEPEPETSEEPDAQAADSDDPDPVPEEPAEDTSEVTESD